MRILDDSASFLSAFSGLRDCQLLWLRQLTLDQRRTSLCISAANLVIWLSSELSDPGCDASISLPSLWANARSRVRCDLEARTGAMVGFDRTPNFSLHIDENRRFVDEFDRAN